MHILNPTVIDPDIDGGEQRPILSVPIELDQGDVRISPPEPADLPPAADHAQPAPPFQPSPSTVVTATTAVGGIVLDSGTVDVTAGVVVRQIGVTGNDARPIASTIIVRQTAGAGSCSIMPNGSPDSLGLGFVIPPAAANSPVTLGVKRLNLQITGPATVTWLVIGSDVPVTNR